LLQTTTPICFKLSSQTLKKTQYTGLRLEKKIAENTFFRKKTLFPLKKKHSFFRKIKNTFFRKKKTFFRKKNIFS